MKQILLLTGVRRGNRNTCVMMKQGQGHIQGGANRRESIGEEDKWNENERGMKRMEGGIGVTMPNAPYAISHWASWLSEAGPRRVPDASK
jgi:hypothetical protein